MDTIVSERTGKKRKSVEQTVEEILEADRDFNRAIGFCVATRGLFQTRMTLNREQASPPEPFPEELRNAIYEAAGEYSQAVADLHAIGPREVSDLFRREQRVERARQAMQYRLAQGLSELHLWMFIDFETTPQVIGWKPGDYSKDKVVKAVPA